jgi:ribosomal protein S18 acetylase RimI-like enzyme
MNVAIRDARPDDVSELGRVHVRAWQAAYHGVMPDEYLDGLIPADRAAMWARFFERAQPDRRLTVVTVDDRVVGFACFGSCPTSAEVPLGELFAINLDPEHWGRGLGRTLLLEVTRQLVAFGEEAVLWVVPENARARGLYESAGWIDDGGRRHDEVLGAHVNEVRYRITLRP